MSNPYFTHTNRLIRYSLARAEQVNAIADSIANGFGLLPTPEQLYLGNTTYQEDTGVSANVYSVTVPVGLTGYVAGMTVLMRPNNTNTGASTLNVNGLGPVAIKAFTGTDDIAAGTIVINELANLIYDEASNVFRFTNVGSRGDNGWAPILAIANDGDRRVHRVVDWTGGQGTKPATGSYLGASGFVANIVDAVNIRGAAGLPGSGSGDMIGANNLSDIVSASTARTNLGATTVGANLFTLANPGAISFLRINADNTVTSRSAANFRSDIATTVGGNLMNLTNPGAVSFLRVNADNTVNARSATNTRTDLGATTVGANLFTLANPSAVRLLRINADNTVSTRTPAETRTDLGATTVGGNIFQLTNPGAISFIRINADNTASTRTPTQFLSDVGATTVGQSFLGLGTPAGVRFARVNTDGSVTLLSDSGTRVALGATTVGGNIFQLSNPNAIRFLRINANNTVTARSDSEIRGDIGVDASATYTIATSSTLNWVNSATYIRVVRIGNYAIAWVNFTSQSGSSSTAATNFVTIASGFRPSSTTYSHLTAMSSSSLSLEYGVLVEVATNGVVTFSRFSTATTDCLGSACIIWQVP